MRLAILFFAASLAVLAQKYTGPIPAKEDMLYIVQADNLIPTESATAQEQKGKKDEILYYIAGAGSTARTPLASPAFVIKVKDLDAQKLELYRLEVRNGRREITFRNGKNAKNPVALRVDVHRLSEGLFRIEVNQSLANGQYSFTPTGSNDVFCFEVY